MNPPPHTHTGLCSYLPPALQSCSLHFSHAGLPSEPRPCSASAPGSYCASALTTMHLTSQSSSLACVSFRPEQKHHFFEVGFSFALPSRNFHCRRCLFLSSVKVRFLSSAVGEGPLSLPPPHCETWQRPCLSFPVPFLYVYPSARYDYQQNAQKNKREPVSAVTNKVRCHLPWSMPKCWEARHTDTRTRQHEPGPSVRLMPTGANKGHAGRLDRVGHFWLGEEFILKG